MPTTDFAMRRRTILQASASIGALAALAPISGAWAQTELRRTADQILGPFYPIMKEPNTSGDLTRVAGGTGRAKGQVLNVEGRVLNPGGEPVRGARIEVWQVNAVGRYAHPDDTNPAPLDPNFEGFGLVITDADGRYAFKTIKPVPYPTGPESFRPAHIHFDVRGKHDQLITQMYFEGDPYNDKDRNLQSLRRPETLIVKLRSPTSDQESDSVSAVFDMVIRG